MPEKTERFGTAYYDLDEIKILIREPDKRFITKSSHLTAVSLGYHGAMIWLKE